MKIDRERLIAAIIAGLMAFLGALTAGRMVTLTAPVQDGAQPVAETAQPPKPPQGPDPLNAVVRITRPGVGCSATIIGPRRDDGRYWVLTAAHCVTSANERWTAHLRRGGSVGWTVVSLNRAADYAWGVTDTTGMDLPWAELAPDAPPVGTPVWHAGFGTHEPGNREAGRVTAGTNTDGQVELEISVSTGDSGGGVVMDPTGRVIAVVCCTSAPGKRARVLGASPVAARRGQTSLALDDTWAPIPIPTIQPKP